MLDFSGVCFTNKVQCDCSSGNCKALVVGVINTLIGYVAIYIEIYIRNSINTSPIASP